MTRKPTPGTLPHLLKLIVLASFVALNMGQTMAQQSTFTPEEMVSAFMHYIIKGCKWRDFKEGDGRKLVFIYLGNSAPQNAAFAKLLSVNVAGPSGNYERLDYRQVRTVEELERIQTCNLIYMDESFNPEYERINDHFKGQNIIIATRNLRRGMDAYFDIIDQVSPTPGDGINFQISLNLISFIASRVYFSEDFLTATNYSEVDPMKVYQTMIDSTNTMSAQLSNVFAELDEAKQQAERDRVIQENEMARLRDDQRQLELKSEQLQMQNQSFTEQLSSAEAELEKSRLEKIDIEALIEESNRKLKERESELVVSQMMLSSQQDTMTRRQAELELLDQRIRQKNDSIEQLREQSERSNQEVARQQESIEDLTKWIAGLLLLSAVVVGLFFWAISSKRSKDKAYKELEEKKLDLESANSELEQKNLTIAEANRELEEKNIAINKQKERASSQAQILNKANTKLNEKTKALEDALDKLKNTQTQLVQSEKMASLGQLTAGIAHEINNPINYVHAGITSLESILPKILKVVRLYEQVEPENAAETLEEIEELKDDIEFDELLLGVEELTRSIKRGATRTAEIVKGLRVFSRLDENDLKLSDIHLNLDSTLTILKNQYKNRITVVRQYAELPEILCYPGKLNQVFMNVLNNAIQAIKGPGTITIGTRAETRDGSNMVRVSIGDTGMGIPEEIRDRIFEPFFTSKDVGEGTGLGLSITYNIIKKHKGLIELDSEVGVGTTFHILLPVNLVPEKDASAD